MCNNIVIVTNVKNELIDPVTLNFDLSTHNHVTSIGYPKAIPCTKFENFVIIRF